MKILGIKLKGNLRALFLNLKTRQGRRVKHLSNLGKKSILLLLLFVIILLTML